MNELQIAWMSAMSVVLVGVCGALYAFALTSSQRLSRVEVVIELLSDKAAKILHSPHTPELDLFLDRLEKETLSIVDVPKFVEMLDSIQNDTKEPKGNRLAAVLTHIKVCRRFNLPIPPIDSKMIKID